MDINALLNSAINLITRYPLYAAGALVLIVAILMLITLTTQSDGGARKKISRSAARKLEKQREELKRGGQSR